VTRRGIHIANIIRRFGFAALLHMFGLDRFLPRPSGGKIDAATRGLEPPVRVRLLLEEIGPAGVKIGQALAARADLLPHEYIVELRKLQDEVPPFPYAAARAVIEQELGCPLEEYFAEFDPLPVAAASLSQVHRARRHDGREVAVKVQRPEVRQLIEQDLQMLTFAAGFAQGRNEWCRENDVVGWAAEFAHILRAELDFTREGHNTDRLRENLVETPYILVPQVHWDLTSHRVLVLDYVEGVSPQDDAALESLGVDRPRLAQRFAQMMFQQVTEVGFFHADPHAGNIKVLRDGRLALLDAGHVDFAGRDMRDHILTLLQALLEGDSRSLVNTLLGVGVMSARTDLSLLRLDADKLVARFSPKRSSGGYAFAEALDMLFSLLVKHGVRVPATFASLMRALMITLGVCLTLDPEFDVWAATAQAVREIARQRLRPHEMFALAQSSLREWGYFARALPRQLSDLILRTQAGGTRVKLELENLDRPLHRLDIMVNRLSFAVVVGSIIIGSATILASASATATVSHSVAVGFSVVGGAMGLWLMYSILRSGRL
jgi:ubiquinone biosynthesis protein